MAGTGAMNLAPTVFFLIGCRGQHTLEWAITRHQRGGELIVPVTAAPGPGGGADYTAGFSAALAPVRDDHDPLPLSF